MNILIHNYLNTDKKHLNYLRNNSYWYKYLNRNPENIKKMISEAKTYYRNNTTNKIDNILDSVDLVTELINFE